jgi:hypothetical protein
VPIRDWLEAHPQPDWVRFEERIEALSRGPRGHLAGDLVLVARGGLAVPPEERFYFSSPQHSGHGGPGRLDSIVPLVIARPGGDGRAIREALSPHAGANPSQTALTPLVLELLGQRD